MEFTSRIAEYATVLLDLAGIVVLVGGFGYSLLRALRPSRGDDTRYRRMRQDMGRTILLGLELLVAADIVRTVAIEPSMERVGVLAVVVLVRTFLSMSIEVELQGRLPWRAREEPGERTPH